MVFWGRFVFIISQPLLRLPILQYLQSSVDFELAYTLNPLLIGVLIALSAGVFEEGFRFVFKRFLLKPDKCSFSQPIIFGLGHGVAEALIILLPVFIFSTCFTVRISHIRENNGCYFSYYPDSIGMEWLSDKEENLVFADSNSCSTALLIL